MSKSLRSTPCDTVAESARACQHNIAGDLVRCLQALSPKTIHHANDKSHHTGNAFCAAQK